MQQRGSCVYRRRNWSLPCKGRLYHFSHNFQRTLCVITRSPLTAPPLLPLRLCASTTSLIRQCFPGNWATSSALSLISLTEISLRTFRPVQFHLFSTFCCFTTRHIHLTASNLSPGCSFSKWTRQSTCTIAKFIWIFDKHASVRQTFIIRAWMSLLEIFDISSARSRNGSGTMTTTCNPVICLPFHLLESSNKAKLPASGEWFANHFYVESVISYCLKFKTPGVEHFALSHLSSLTNFALATDCGP